jgi:hypothetical protein
MPYNTKLTAEGGIKPYRYKVAAGRLPPGLKLSRRGKLQGTPTDAGLYSFTVQVQDGRGFVSEQAYRLRIRR